MSVITTISTLSTLATLSLLSTVALADVDDADLDDDTTEVAPAKDTTSVRTPRVKAVAAEPVAAEPAAQPAAEPAAIATKDTADEGWHSPAGARFTHGFRMGWTYIKNFDKPTRDSGMSLKDEFHLKTPHMMLLGYEGFYRVLGHSWLNVVMVGNVTVAGLEQSKFIPAASGLIGFEFDRNFQVGVGVNLMPDPQAPSHMIAAAGWTPRVGSIQTPIHFFYVPDPSGNTRMGATVGMNW